MQHLKDLRKAYGISQERLAEHLNLNQRSISKYENGICEPDFKALKDIAVFFNTSIDYLVDDNEPLNKNYVRDYPFEYHTEKEIAFLNEFRKMSTEEQDALLTLMSRSKKRKK